MITEQPVIILILTVIIGAAVLQVITMTLYFILLTNNKGEETIGMEKVAIIGACGASVVYMCQYLLYQSPVTELGHLAPISTAVLIVLGTMLAFTAIIRKVNGAITMSLVAVIMTLTLGMPTMNF